MQAFYPARGRLGRLDTLSTGSGVALLAPPEGTTDSEAHRLSLIASMIYPTRGRILEEYLSWHSLA